MWRTDWTEGREERERPLADHGAVQATMTNNTQEFLILPGTLRSNHIRHHHLHLPCGEVALCKVCWANSVTDERLHLTLNENRKSVPPLPPPKNRSPLGAKLALVLLPPPQSTWIDLPLPGFAEVSVTVPCTQAGTQGHKAPWNASSPAGWLWPKLCASDSHSVK